MGEVAELVSGLSRHLVTPRFALLTLVLQILVPYHRYVRYLKWLTFSLLAMRQCYLRSTFRGERS